jgi:hypothetical protein
MLRHVASWGDRIPHAGKDARFAVNLSRQLGGRGARCKVGKIAVRVVARHETSSGDFAHPTTPVPQFGHELVLHYTA